ncbi:hypothetical protein H6F74_24400 [Trichocoleus sp. FACHB-90]|uniref:hypothetical protein n=1 Tax=Cyanophyceae TaxID=3028117 RepID=UPI00168762AA|nr:hypothetical protein [Trichocoleus sp. FACHB-90]MBD1929358.1 hypothetical protein [Trichocoleus sp. FACHB-90]
MGIAKNVTQSLVPNPQSPVPNPQSPADFVNNRGEFIRHPTTDTGWLQNGSLILQDTID